MSRKSSSLQSLNSQNFWSKIPTIRWKALLLPCVTCICCDGKSVINNQMGGARIKNRASEGGSNGWGQSGRYVTRSPATPLATRALFMRVFSSRLNADSKKNGKAQIRALPPLFGPVTNGLKGWNTQRVNYCWTNPFGQAYDRPHWASQRAAAA